MLKIASIQVLEDQTPNYSSFHGNPEVNYIFNHILLNEANLIKMYDYSLANKPALEAVVSEIENYFDSISNPTFDIKNNSHSKTYIGRAISVCLEPLGLQKYNSARLSKSANSNYFSSASVYTPTPNSKFKIVKHIEKI